MTHQQNDLLRLALVIGSTREGRFGPTVAQWFAHDEQAAQEAAARMLRQLTWWAIALRTARASSQYPA